MNSKKLLTTGALVTTLLCGVAHARSISTAGWTDQNGAVIVTSGPSVTVTSDDLSNVTGWTPESLLPALTITPGGQSGSVNQGVNGHELEYSWGGTASPNTTSTNPADLHASAQVILSPDAFDSLTGDVTKFDVSFGYNPGDDAAVPFDASLVFDGTKYSAPLNSTSSYLDSDLTITDVSGVWDVSSTDAWSQEAVAPSAAPEIDPASSASALTLLAGGLLILFGRKSRRSNASLA
jgi:hypothetical protein